jgi:hypothetical protein
VARVVALSQQAPKQTLHATLRSGRV